MKNIYSSATKITLLTLVVALIALTFLGKADTEPFKSVVLMVISFYFGQKVNTPVDTNIG